MSPVDLTQPINDYLIRHLEQAGCSNGHFSCETPGTSLLLTLRGHKPGLDKPLYFWHWTPAFKRLAWAYLASVKPELRAFSVDIDVTHRQCHYQTSSAAAYERQLQQTEAESQAALRQQQQQWRDSLAARTTPYGPALAQAVADRLRTGEQMGQSHRDYGGTGLRYAQGHFAYVSLWDYEASPIQTFDDEAAFVAWLSQQSDASLAHLDSPSPVYWGNQTITQRRLADFVAEQPGPQGAGADGKTSS